jgi:hypothetical protein
MKKKSQQGQGAVWIVLIITIVIIVVFWLSKNPSDVIIPQQPTSTESGTPSIAVTVTPKPTQSLDEINEAIKELNESAANIDNGINDSQLDITQ